MKKIFSFFLLLGTFSAFSAEVRVNSNQVEFNVNKDVEINTATLGIRCLRKAGILEQLNNGLKEYTECNDFKVNGVKPAYYSPSIELKKIGKNKFLLEKDALIKFSTSRKGHVCVIIKAEFKDFKIQFERGEDTYSLLSYCSVKTLPFATNDYVYNNRRVSTLEQFNDALGRPIQVNLK